MHSIKFVGSFSKDVEGVLKEGSEILKERFLVWWKIKAEKVTLPFTQIGPVPSFGKSFDWGWCFNLPVTHNDNQDIMAI